MANKDITSQIAKDLDTLMRRVLPIKVGRMAVSHYKDNFRQGGFVNGGLHPWQEVQRRLRGGSSAKDNKGILLSDRNNLYNSVQYLPCDGTVKVFTEVPYAGLHNYGGVVQPRITPKMRRFAWAKFFEAGGGKGDAVVSPEAQMWRGLALTRKTQLSIRIPQRQFLGASNELDEKINETITTELSKIIDKWNNSL